MLISCDFGLASVGAEGVQYQNACDWLRRCTPRPLTSLVRPALAVAGGIVGVELSWLGTGVFATSSFSCQFHSVECFLSSRRQTLILHSFPFWPCSTYSRKTPLYAVTGGLRLPTIIPLLMHILLLCLSSSSQVDLALEDQRPAPHKCSFFIHLLTNLCKLF